MNKSIIPLMYYLGYCTDKNVAALKYEDFLPCTYRLKNS